MVGALCGSEISSIRGVFPAMKRGISSRSIATSSSGLISIEIATAPISSDAISGVSTREPAAAWNTTKANSPPCASSSVNTGRSCTGSPIMRARL